MIIFFIFFFLYSTSEFQPIHMNINIIGKRFFQCDFSHILKKNSERAQPGIKYIMEKNDEFIPPENSD